MSMHLVGPWLSTSGKRKSKRRFRTADQAKKTRNLQEDWQNLLNKHDIAAKKPSKKKEFVPLSNKVPNLSNYRGADQPRIPSLPFTGEICARPTQKTYTGDKMIGIGTLHKSNAIPVFSDDLVKDIAKMRRS